MIIIHDETRYLLNISSASLGFITIVSIVSHTTIFLDFPQYIRKIVTIRNKTLKPVKVPQNGRAHLLCTVTVMVR